MLLIMHCKVSKQCLDINSNHMDLRYTQEPNISTCMPNTAIALKKMHSFYKMKFLASTCYKGSHKDLRKGETGKIFYV